MVNFRVDRPTAPQEGVLLRSSDAANRTLPLYAFRSNYGHLVDVIALCQAQCSEVFSQTEVS